MAVTNVSQSKEGYPCSAVGVRLMLLSKLLNY